MKFLYVVRKSIPHVFTVGFCKIMSVEGERWISRSSIEWRLQSLLVLPSVGNPNRATGGGALDSTKNTTIDNGECFSDYIEVRDEFIAIGG